MRGDDEHIRAVRGDITTGLKLRAEQIDVILPHVYTACERKDEERSSQIIGVHIIWATQFVPNDGYQKQSIKLIYIYIWSTCIQHAKGKKRKGLRIIGVHIIQATQFVHNDGYQKTVFSSSEPERYIERETKHAERYGKGRNTSIHRISYTRNIKRREVCV